MLAAVAVGLVGILVLGFVLTRLMPVRNGSTRIGPPSPATRVTVVLAIALLTAVVVGEFLILTQGGASFAIAGLQRYISAPVVYGGFALVAVTTAGYYVRRWPLWVLGLLVITAVSTLFSPLAGPRFTTATLLQGLVLFGGTALFAMCGLLNAEWSRTQRRRLLLLLLGSGTILGLLTLATGIFSALVIPTAAVLIYLARDRVRLWPVWAVAGIAIIVLTVQANSDAVDPSAASTGQLVVAGGILVLAAVPPRARLTLVVLGVLVGAIAAIGSDVPGLFFGRGADLDDVTLAQRAYETQQVIQQSTSPLTLLFGAGPGATVDLSLSPDAGTLASSGRVLQSVPSVHLLTSYVLMKSGLLGLAWLAVFLVAAFTATVRVLRRPRPDLFDLVLVVFVLCGIIQAVPAATYLFSNPLPALLLAILHVRHLHEEDGYQGPIDPARVPVPMRRGFAAPLRAPGKVVRRLSDSRDRTGRP